MEEIAVLLEIFSDLLSRNIEGSSDGKAAFGFARFEDIGIFVRIQIHAVVFQFIEQFQIMFGAEELGDAFHRLFSDTVDIRQELLVRKILDDVFVMQLL